MDQEKLAEDIGSLKTATSEIDNNVKKILNAVYGKGGLVTQTALNKSAIKRIWVFLIVFSSAIAAAIAKAITN